MMRRAATKLPLSTAALLASNTNGCFYTADSPTSRMHAVAIRANTENATKTGSSFSDRVRNRVRNLVRSFLAEPAESQVYADAQYLFKKHVCCDTRSTKATVRGAVFCLWATPYVCGAFAFYLWLSDTSTEKVPTKSRPDLDQLSAFNHAIARAYETHQPVIVTGHRGQGKTTTAIAAAAASASLFSNGPTARYVDGKTVSENKTASEAQLRIAEARRSRTFSIVLEYPLLCVATVIFTRVAPWKKFAHGLAVMTMGTLLAPLHRGPDVLIVDDVSQHLVAVDGETEMEAYTKLLESLTPPVVIVSSNEGIDECFRDVAPLNRIQVALPNPSLATLEKSLAAMWLDSSPKEKGSTAAQGGPQTAETTTGSHSQVEGGTPAVPTAKTVVEKACERLPDHHSRSMRWWRFFTKAELEQWTTAPPTTTVLPRAKLFRVAALLDLTTQEPARAITLGSSPILSAKEVDQLRVAVGGSEEVFKKNFPPSCPRRLGLTWALALTAKSGESGLFHSMLKVLSVNKGDEHVCVFRHYISSIEPLVVKLTELVNEKTE